MPAAVAAMQTFGDFPVGFHPRLHILVSDPLEADFHEGGLFSVSPTVDPKAVEQILRHNVLKMLLVKGKINREMIALLDKWRHSGFNVFFGPRILPGQEKSMEDLAWYTLSASGGSCAHPSLGRG